MTDLAVLRLAHAGLSPRRTAGLVARFGSARAVVEAMTSGSVTVSPLVLAAVSVSGQDRQRQLQDAGISFVPRGSSAYPVRLGRFDDAPPWLFVLGPPDDLHQPTIGIVGSRSCTTYGRALAEGYGSTSSDAGWCVVSGLARGIDAAAHRGAVMGPTPCVGVVGSGIDIVYPVENRALYDDLLGAGGRIVSEYPPGTRPDGWRFPTRNRIIAGLSDVVLVVEATHTGGALITARVALDYGVPIYAVPGDVDRPTSEGTNALIRDGAFPIFGPDDLAEVLHLVQPLVV